MRRLSYVDALNQALHQIMAMDERVTLIGQGVNSPWYVGSSCTGLLDRFGERRVIDTPVSENAVTGAAVGMALAGMRPIVVHPRMDFMYYAMDPIANQASNWHYMMGSKLSVPLVIWGIINRGEEQGAQHSQAIHSLFSHLPGIKVIMPSTPFDVKGMLCSAVEDGNPVLFADDRWLYRIEGDVPEELYRVPLAKGKVRRQGEDVTIVATSFLVHEALRAAESLEVKGIQAEVIDPLTVKPLDREIIIESVRRTGRLVAVDGGWKSFGAAAEISATVAESDAVRRLKHPIIRVALPDAPAPASRALEAGYYRTAKDIERAVLDAMG